MAILTNPVAANELAFKTARKRFEMFIDDAQPIGRAFNAIRDAVTRGWLPNMHFIAYDGLTRRPQSTLKHIYRFLGGESHQHDFERVEQVTFEDDTAYGFKDLHTIRPKVAPQEPQWPHILDNTVRESPAWANVEKFAAFWRAY